jgi:drug/metabolite transporter (DMT)-like permease
MAEGQRRRSIAESVEGESSGDFTIRDWTELVVAAGIFGSAFLWIALALRSIAPGTIAFGRVVLGAAALAAVPAARCAIHRVDWPRLAIAALLGMATPVLLFALAEERIPSALAGMLVSSIPIMTAVVAAIETRTWPTRRRVTGLAIGFVGIALLALPNLTAAGSEALGVLMALGAVLAYAIAGTLYAPLQQSYGSLRVTLWLLVVSAVMLFPLGLLGAGDSSVELVSVASLVFLGIVGTGAVWALFVGLVGRVGAVRASIAGYLIPIAALVLGVAVLDESVEAVQVAGVLVALVGGYVLSRGSESPVSSPDGEVTPEQAVAIVDHQEPSGIDMCR